MKPAHLALSLLLLVPVGASAQVEINATAGLTQRLGARGAGRLLVEQGLRYDADGWLIGLRTGQVLGADTATLRLGGELGYRFHLFTWLHLAPLVTAGYARLAPTVPNVEGALNGAHAALAVEVGVALGDTVVLTLRPEAGGTAYPRTLVQPTAAASAGLTWTF